MGIRLTDNDAVKTLKSAFRELDKNIVTRMAYVGEMAVNEARSYGHGKDYKDRTGNLRSSTGYAMTRDGEIVSVSSFDDVPPTEDAKGESGKGGAIGKEKAKELAGQIPQGYALVVVAGMEYAEYVAAKGYDVLDSAERVAAQEMGSQIEKAIKDVFG